MAGVGNVMPSLASFGRSSAAHGLLDLVFRDNALIMSDIRLLISKLAGVGIGIPFPIVGFSFETPSNVDFLNYSYSEYPMLNKEVVTNSFLRQSGSVTIKATRPITRGNNVLVNYITNTMLIKLIKNYCDNGGLWALNTMWGYVNNLALEKLSGTEVSGVGGIGFEFQFKRINFDNSGLASKVSNVVSMLAV